MYRLMVADVDSPSYFVATAAAKLGFFAQEGIDVEFEAVYGAKYGPERLRDGTLHFLGGPAYVATRAFPGWKGAKLLCALSQYSYWFMAVRADLKIKRGDLNAVKGLRIACSPTFPEMGLRYMLAEAGIDPVRDNVGIVASPTAPGQEHLKGRDGVIAIERGVADGYWGNGMRVAIGEHLGVAKLHLDLRRGDGPPGARWYNFAALTTTEQFVREQPQAAAAAIRAIVKTQRALKLDPGLATEVARDLFPREEASLIADLIARDAPFYDATISTEAVTGLNKFAKANGLIVAPIPYDELVASEFRDLWSGQ
ncbi:MAG: ABC transporter substrate-binding protein [Xanthobacteraceae bacterium]